MIEEKEKKGKTNQLNYFAIHITHLIVGILFLSVGIITLIYYDYGMISFLFAIPQFFLTGMVPLLISLLILFRTIFEAEKVSFSSNEKSIKIKTTWIRKKIVQYDISSINYVGLKYRETRVKRWIIIAVVTLLTIEVLFQNAVDLYGYARIAPILTICFILMTIGIILFVFIPRRFIEIGTNSESTLIPYRNLSEVKTQQLLQILKVNPTHLKKRKTSEKLYNNILSQFSSFITGIFLIILGVVLMVNPNLFLGSFTRTIAIILGMKLLLRVLNGDPYFNPSKEDKYLFLGNSLRLTFIKTIDADIKTEKSFSPSRYHYLEIMCFVYLIFQAIKYAFRFIWWAYAPFSLVYFLLGMVIIGLIFIRWFNPITLNKVSFKEFSIAIREAQPIHEMIERSNSLKAILTQKASNFLSSFKNVRENKNILISLVLFIFFLIWPVFYIIFGGNFIII